MTSECLCDGTRTWIAALNVFNLENGTPLLLHQAEGFIQGQPVLPPSLMLGWDAKPEMANDFVYRDLRCRVVPTKLRVINKLESR